MDFLGGLYEVLQPGTLALVCIGTIVGVLVGALPGLSSSMAVALLLPFTIYLDPIPAIAMLAALYCAGTFGGSITAILINAPGAPPAAATAFDGYPLAKKGQAGRALGMAAVASVMGGIFSIVVLIIAAPALATIAFRFGPPEYFALTIFGLSMLASISGKSAVKNLIGGAFGVLLATVGVDLTTGVERFTFGVPQLYDGISFIPVLIGLFAMAELLNQAVQKNQRLERFSMTALRLPTRADFKRVWQTILRSSGIGTFIGILPAEGATVAAMIGYNEAKRWSKNKDNFGKGEIEGVAGPEAANNAATGGAMVPTLALGIPGSATAAVILGGLQIHGLRPGPFLFENQPTLLYAICSAMLIANVVFLIFGLLGARHFSKISLIPRQFLWPCVFCLCVVGAYGSGQSLTDVYIMLAAGFIGYFLNKAGFSPAPIIMGLVLGHLVENSLSQSMIIFDSDVTRFFDRPIAIFFFVLALASIFAAPLKNGVTAIWTKIQSKRVSKTD